MGYLDRPDQDRDSRSMDRIINLDGKEVGMKEDEIVKLSAEKIAWLESENKRLRNLNIELNWQLLRLINQMSEPRVYPLTPGIKK